MSAEPYASIIERPRGAESVGRPLGSGKFLDAVEHKTRRVLKPAKRG
jgi:putative transposase